MAAPSSKAVAYKQRADAYSWREIATLWDQVKAGETPDWDNGKALEYLVVRAFRLSGLQVEYPYDVPPGGKPIEQIDGLVYLGELAFIIECKDTKDAVDMEVIAKVCNRLARRPPTTMGCVFVAGSFSTSALLLADLTTPHRVTLWTQDDIEASFRASDFKATLEKKYRYLCQFGLVDHSTHYRELEDLK